MWKTSVPQRCFLTQFEGWIQGGCERVLKALQQGHYICREADTPTGSLAVLWNHCNQRRTSLQMIWETLIRSDLALFFSYPMFFLSHPLLKLFPCSDILLHQHFKGTCELTRVRERGWGCPGCRQALNSSSVPFGHMVRPQKWENQEQVPRSASALASCSSLLSASHGTWGFVADALF